MARRNQDDATLIRLLPGPIKPRPKKTQLEPVSQRLKRFRAFILLIIAYSSIRSLLWLTSPSQNATTIPPNTPYKTTPLNIPIDPNFPPGIGFDLEPTYGTATIRIHPNTTVHIGPINGSANYRDTMHRLSLDAAKHMSPPYNWWQDPPGGVLAGWYDAPREWVRSLRKKVGWPASAEVGALAEVLGELRDVVEGVLGRKVESGVVTSPYVVALYDEVS